MAIPDDPLERKKWMLKLWREDYGARFSVFNPEDQPAPELERWQPEMWEQCDPVADDKGNFDPQVIRHIRWFERIKEFLQERYGLAIGPDLFFDCRAMQCQGSLSVEIAPDKERLWYLKALRLGVFLFHGKLGVGLSCRSRSCQRKKCPLNLKNEERLNRVDLYQLLQILEGQAAMPLARAVAESQGGSDCPFTVLGKPTAQCPSNRSTGKLSAIRRIYLGSSRISQTAANGLHWSTLISSRPAMRFIRTAFSFRRR